MKFHGQCAVEENAEAFDRVRERDCGIVKLNAVDGKPSGRRKSYANCERRKCFIYICSRTALERL